eukprot:1140332-Pelagomonas_calceolata.AAC.7
MVHCRAHLVNEIKASQKESLGFTAGLLILMEVVVVVVLLQLLLLLLTAAPLAAPHAYIESIT